MLHLRNSTDFNTVWRSSGAMEKDMFNSRINFTKETIQGLPILSKAYSILDEKTPNLRIAVYPSGVKTYLLCKKVKYKWQRIKIARTTDLSIEQARKEAIRLNSLIALGNDPQAEKQAGRKEVKFRELFNYYYNHHLKVFTKHPEDNRKIAEYHIFPAFGNSKASDVTSEKVRRFHAKIAETHSKSSANRIVTIIAATYNFCIKNSFYNGINPCSFVKKFKTVSRDRFLSHDELKKFFEAVEQEEELFQDFFLLLLFTAARKSNVLSMKWVDIDLSLKRWRIAENETKNQDVNFIMLTEPAIEILQKRNAKNKALENPSPFVFPGDGKVGHLIDPKRAFDRVRERMSILNFRMHDLRRTLASYMAIGGTSLPIIGKALNHKSQVSTSIYARLSQDPVLDAMNSAVLLIRDTGIAKLFKANCEMTFHLYTPRQFSSLLS